MWGNNPLHAVGGGVFLNQTFTFPGLQMAVFSFFLWLLCRLFDRSQSLHLLFQIFLTVLDFCQFALLKQSKNDQFN